jgi:alpha-tubulin suppressor-like RCC1 family protein
MSETIGIDVKKKLARLEQVANVSAARCLSVTVFAFALACSDSTAPASLPPLDGMWDYVGDRIVNGTTPTVCNDTGTFTFIRTDAAWTGTAQVVSTCRTGPTVSTFSETATIGSGVATDGRFTFLRNSLGSSCADTAVAAPGLLVALSGTEQCGTARGTWRAVHGGPLASVSLAPTTLLTVPGYARTLDLVMRSASGQRVFGRPVVWASDRDAVAAVSLGTVTGVGVGSATITATAEAKTATTNVTVLPPTSLVAVTAGDAFTCALGADQRAYCWGHAPLFQLSTIPVPVQAAPAFASISTSQRFVCGVSLAHEVWCWGGNESGQLGNGTTVDTATPARVQASGKSFAMVTSGGRHSCALATDGHAWCWGANDAGQLGDLSLTASSLPVAVSGGLTFTALSAGDSHTCGIVPGGALYCWGSNTRGQVGDSTTTNRGAPTLVNGSHTFQAVSAGHFHTCGIVTGGIAWCWGQNGAGQFGNGGTIGATFPVPAAMGLTLTSLASSLNYGCGVTVAGDIWCWGFAGVGVWGQLGNGGRVGSSAPVKVSGGLAWASVTTGVSSDESTNAGSAAQTCGVTTSGTAWCWGNNLIGQLGNGTRTESYVPVRVSGQP